MMSSNPLTKYLGLGGVYRLSEDERIAVRKGMEAARRGDFVPDEEMAAFYRRMQG